MNASPLPSWLTQPLWPSLSITPARLLLAALALVVAWVISLSQRTLLRRASAQGRLDIGLRYSLERLLNYLMMSIGAIVALSVLGVDIRSLTVLGGALGVGVGFGLQTIVNNFVSGLVLLFERPVRVGDRISLGTLDADAASQINGYVSEIGLRATRVVTPDNITLIVPNSELVSRTVVNWSLANQRLRLRLAVKVAYGSDLERVEAVMNGVARAHPAVAAEPAAQARMTGTGESGLEYTLFAWIEDPRDRGPVETDLRENIVVAFRKAGITMPFPQREVRLLDHPRL